MVYADAGYWGFEKQEEMQGRGVGFRVAKPTWKRRALSDTPEVRLDDLVETAMAHIQAKGEHSFRVMKQRFGFQRTRLKRMLKRRCKIHVLSAHSILFMAWYELPCKISFGE